MTPTPPTCHKFTYSISSFSIYFSLSPHALVCVCFRARRKTNANPWVIRSCVHVVAVIVLCCHIVGDTMRGIMTTQPCSLMPRLKPTPPVVLGLMLACVTSSHPFSFAFGPQLAHQALTAFNLISKPKIYAFISPRF